jgi:hypothetical protein
VLLGYRGGAQIAEERSDEGGVCDLGAGPAVTEDGRLGQCSGMTPEALH